MHPNFPAADTILIVELDGPAAEVRSLFGIVEETCRRTGATQIEIAPDDEQRARIWRGRKAAFAAMGRVSPNYYVQDGVVPRTKLPEVLGQASGTLEARSGLRIGNVFHAGDGNLHPLICYDESVPGRIGSRRRGGRRDPVVLRRGRRIDHRRARRRRRQGRVHAADVHRRRPRRDAARARSPSTRAICATRERSFRRRGCAAKCPVRIAASCRTGGPGRTVLRLHDQRAGSVDVPRRSSRPAILPVLQSCAVQRTATAADAIDGVQPRYVVEPASAEALAGLAGVGVARARLGRAARPRHQAGMGPPPRPDRSRRQHAPAEPRAGARARRPHGDGRSRARPSRDVNRRAGAARSVAAARDVVRGGDDRRHDCHQRQRAAAPPARHAARSADRRSPRDDRRSPGEGGRQRRQERGRLRSRQAGQRIVRQPRGDRDRDVQARAAAGGVDDAGRGVWRSPRRWRRRSRPSARASSSRRAFDVHVARRQPDPRTTDPHRRRGRLAFGRGVRRRT